MLAASATNLPRAWTQPLPSRGSVLQRVAVCCSLTNPPHDGSERDNLAARLNAAATVFNTLRSTVNDKHIAYRARMLAAMSARRTTHARLDLYMSSFAEWKHFFEVRTTVRDCARSAQVEILKSRLHVLHHLAVFQCIAVWCSVLQCVAVCCSVLQCVAMYYITNVGSLLHVQPIAL